MTDIIDQDLFFFTGSGTHEQICALKGVAEFNNTTFTITDENLTREGNWFGVWNSRKNAWKCFFRCKQCADDEVKTWGADYLTVYPVSVGVPEKPNV